MWWWWLWWDFLVGSDVVSDWGECGRGAQREPVLFFFCTALVVPLLCIGCALAALFAAVRRSPVAGFVVLHPGPSYMGNLCQ